MKYVDANIFILAIIGDEKRKGQAQRILKQIIEGKIEALTSFLSWDEFVHIIKKHLGREIGLKESKKLLEFPYLDFINVDGAVISKAHELMELYFLGPRDAIHAATALINGANEIVSDDSDFDKIKELKRIPLEECIDVKENLSKEKILSDGEAEELEDATKDIRKEKGFRI